MSTIAPPKPPPPSTRGPAPAPTVKPLRIGTPRIAAQPVKLVLNAVEGFGKTTASAHAPKPLIVMARGERGYVTLRAHGRVPECLTLTDDNGEPRCAESWLEVLAVADQAVGNCQTLVFDALNGLERLCHEFVCARDFGGQWGEKGFGAYQRGPDVAVSDWLQLLARLDQVHAAGVNVILLSHAKAVTFKNPAGPDFTRYAADCHEKTWSATARWADAVLFGQFRTITEEKQRGRVKGIGGTERVIYTERRDAWDAKNRYGLPAEIEIPDQPDQVWSTVYGMIQNTNPESK